MLSRLINAFNPSIAPSALLVIGNFGVMAYILHLIPENGSIERFGLASASTTFRRHRAREQARDQIGTVTLHVGDGETADSFLDDAEIRIHKRWNDSLGLSPAQLQMSSVDVTRLVQDVLQPAALEAIHEREGRDRSMNATQTYPVYIVYIKRSRAGGLLTAEPTSFPS